jgi:hypothetical protein
LYPKEVGFTQEKILSSHQISPRRGKTNSKITVQCNTEHRKLAKAVIGSGAKCVQPRKQLMKTKSPVTKLVVQPYTAKGGESGIAVIFSISHLVADGHTYFHILNMLSTASLGAAAGGAATAPAVYALDPLRTPEYLKVEAAAMGEKEMAWGTGIKFIDMCGVALWLVLVCFLPSKCLSS